MMSKLLCMPNINFGDAINLSNSLAYSAMPQVAVLDEKHVYVIWHESSGLFGPQRQKPDVQKSVRILYKVSHDNGSSFGDVRELYSFQNTLSFLPPVVSVHGGRAMVAWSDTIDNEVAVFFTRITADSNNFEKPRRLEGDNDRRADVRRAGMSKNVPSTVNPRNPIFTGAPFPRIAVSGKNVYLVWLGIKDLLAGSHRENTLHDVDLECNVLFRASYDEGEHFSDATSLGNFRVRGLHQGAGNLASLGPFVLRAKNKNVYVVWHQLGTEPLAGSVLFRKSTDGGQSFSAPIALNRMYRSGDTGSGAAQKTANATILLCGIEIDDIADSEDKLFAVWLVQEQQRSGNKFDPSSLLSHTFNMKYSMYFAKVAGSSGNQGDIDFPTYAKITDSAQGGADSFIRVTRNNVYAFWNDTNTGKITVRASKDGGHTFGPPSGIKGTEPAARNSMNFPVGPFVVCRDNRIFAAWHSYLPRDDADNPRLTGSRSPGEYHLPRTAIAFSFSPDNGETFSLPVSISQKDSWWAAQVHLAASGEYVYTVCSEGREFNPDVYFRLGRIKS